MSKTTLGLLAALLVAGAAYLLLRADRAEHSASTTGDRAFAVERAEDIARIRVADLRGNTLDLSRGGPTGWLVNGEHPASPSVLEQVLKVLTRVSVDHIPPAGTLPMIHEAMATSGIRVTSFGADGAVLRSFIIGPSAQGEKNSYLLLGGADQPYAVRTPGLAGTLRPLFDLRSEDAWRSRTYFDVPPDSIVAVTVDYPLQPGESFRVTRTGEHIALEPGNTLAARDAEPQQRMLASYLEGFADVALVRRTNDYPQWDSLRAATPFARITVARTRGDSLRLNLYPQYLRDRFTGEPLTGEPVAVYFVERDGRELAAVQTPQLQQWLRGYSSFFAE